MQLSVSIWAVIIGISALHGFFLSFVLLKRGQGHKTSNLWFGLIMLIFSFSLLEYTLLLSGHIDSVVHVFSINVPLMVLIGPFLWLFTRQSLTGNTQLGRKDIWHFVPAVLTIFSLLPLYLLSSQDKLQILDSLYNGGETIPLKILLFNLSFFVYLGVYVWLSWKKKNDESLAGPGLKRIQKRVSLVVMIVILFYALSFISFIFFIFPGPWRLEIHYTLILLLSFLIHGVSYKVIFSSDELLSGKVPYQGKSIDQGSELKAILERKLKEEKLYLDPDLKLKTLAEALDMRPHQLSQLINQWFNTNFAGLVNEYRVSEATELLRVRPEEKLLGIALDSGFSNQANFIRVFKQYQGQTPSDYRDFHKK